MTRMVSLDSNRPARRRMIAQGTSSHPETGPSEAIEPSSASGSRGLRSSRDSSDSNDSRDSHGSRDSRGTNGAPREGGGSIAASLKLLAAIGALVFVGAFVAAPYKSADNLRRAVRHGNAERLASAIDFGAVRESLKREVAKQIGTESAPEDAGAALLGTAFANAMIDAVVTPEMLIKARDLPLDEEAKARVDAAVKSAKAGYDGPFRFVIAVTIADVSSEPMKIVLTRSGALSWQVSSIEAPKVDPAALAQATQKMHVPDAT